MQNQNLFVGDGLDSIRCIDRTTLLKTLADLGEKTLDRLEQLGLGPPKTQLSDRRIGYRIRDVAEWLDKRRRPDSFRPIGDSPANWNVTPSKLAT
jgi:hypothetical protein